MRNRWFAEALYFGKGRVRYADDHPASDDVGVCGADARATGPIPAVFL